MAEQSVTLDPGKSRLVSFQTVPQEARTYTVSVDGLMGTFIAKAVAVSAEIKDAYIYNKYAETNPLWNGYAHISLPQDVDDEGNVIAVDWMQIASRDTFIGFVLKNNSIIPLAFGFTLRQHQWVPPNKYEWYDLNPTTAAPLPIVNGVYQADRKLMPQDILESGQRGFIAAPATIGRRWCTFHLSVTHNGRGVASASVKGWGGY